MPRFDVKYTDPKRFFYPGETVAGTITVRIDEPLRVKTITLEFEGASHVLWTTYKHNDIKIHGNNEEYFKHKYILLPQTSPPEEGILLPVGDYTYSFQHQLPNTLPPSFDLSHTDYVRYSMKVAVEDFENDALHYRPDSDSQITFKVVSTPVDLNTTCHLQEPVSKTVEKFLCCLCCQSGPIRLYAELQKQAFHAGEPIVFSFELDNTATNKPLRKTEAKLIKRVTLISSSPAETREFTVTVSSNVLSEGIPPGGESTWKDVKVDIPSDTVPNFQCKCIIVDYYLMVSVDIEYPSSPKVIFPITIVNGVTTIQPGLMGSKNAISNIDTSLHQPSVGPIQPECQTQPENYHPPSHPPSAPNHGDVPS